jgi:hypothetical protein
VPEVCVNELRRLDRSLETPEMDDMIFHPFVGLCHCIVGGDWNCL